jgi:4-hydroxybutyryl-CoA dehydratase/vinylacetyl-CoA-Delta-isomerase
MNAPLPATLMSGADYRESLRRYSPNVFVDGRRVDSVADEPPSNPASMPSPSPTTTR